MRRLHGGPPEPEAVRAARSRGRRRRGAALPFDARPPRGPGARRLGLVTGVFEEGRMRRATVAVLMVGVLWTAVGQAQRRQPPTLPFEYAVFSLGNVQLRDGVRAIGGDVGSNNGTANIGKNVRVAGSVVGRTIKLRQGARPDSLFCLLLQGSIAGLSCEAVGLPVVATNQLPPVQVIPGNQPLHLPH